MTIKAQWRFNGNSNDSSGNGYNGTNTNITFSQANGKVNQGAGFANGKITTTYSNSFSTISFWIRLNSSGWSGDWNTIFEKINLNTSYGLILRREGSNYVVVLSIGNKSGSDSFSNYSINNSIAFNNKFHHVAITQNTDIRVYVNSKLVVTINDDWGNAGNLLLGGSSIPWGTRTLLGAMDNTLVDDICWTPAPIKNEYAKAIGFF